MFLRSGWSTIIQDPMWSVGVLGSWWAVGVLFVLSLLAQQICALRISAKIDEKLSIAPDALRQLLKETYTGGTNCSVALLTDHSPTAEAVIQGLEVGLAGGGTALMSLPPILVKSSPLLAANTSLSPALNDLVRDMRKLRVRRWCFTVALVSDSPQLIRAVLTAAVDSRLLVWSTHLLLMTSLGRHEAFSAVRGLWAFEYMNAVLLLIRPSNLSGRVLRFEPFSSKGPRTKELGLYTQKEGLSLTDHLFSDKYIDFYGAPVNFTVLPFPPYWDEVTVDDGNQCQTTKYSGADYEMLVEIAKALNFTPQYLHSANWDEVTSLVEERKSFMASVMYFVMSHRLEKFDYINPLFVTDLSFAMRQPAEKASWDSYMRPFRWNVWLATVALVLTLPFLLIGVMNFALAEARRAGNLSSLNEQKHHWQPSEGHQTPPKKVSFVTAFMELLAILLGQDFMILKPSMNSYRVLMTAWFIFSLVMTSVYKSNLIAFMTLPKGPARVETLSELVASGAAITAPSYGVDQQTFMRNSNNKEYQILASRYNILSSATEGLDRALSENSAHVEERVYLIFTIASHYMRSDGSTGFYIAQQGLMNFIMSWPIPHDAPYKQQLDKAMLYIIQAGLYGQWHKNEIEKLRIAKSKETKGKQDHASDEHGGLTLPQLQGPFWILLCGCGVATVVFVMELGSVWRARVGREE